VPETIQHTFIMSRKESFATPLTKLFGIKHPILLAGMNVAAGPELAAAVTNAGGLGVIGGLGYTPKFMKEVIQEVKDNLVDKNAPFGVDLLLPQVGGNARKTNHDYTGGQLPQLIDVICESGAKLFVSAVGVPPRWAVEKLHAAGIVCMNMIGSTRHVKKALAAGMDIICAQGTEGGGHTGDTATSVLIPQVVDLCRGKMSELNGKPIQVLAAGGIFDSRGLAMALALGASGVWVGTRFICAEEAGAPPAHQKTVLGLSSEGTARTIIFSGRPLRGAMTPYVKDWEENRREEIKELTGRGILPAYHDIQKREKNGEEVDRSEVQYWLMGQAAGAVNAIEPAADIINEMVDGAIDIMRNNVSIISRI
jgi:NAD(P)H-dependent flavin oxidoreductase YrpB (nitropropane dioxygenase family)